MRVIIYRPHKGTHEITIVPGRGTRKPPLSVRGSSREELVAAARDSIAKLRASDPRPEA